MNKNENLGAVPSSAWKVPASSWGGAIDRYVTFLQVPTWRASVKRDGTDRTRCLSAEQADSLGRKMRDTLRALRGAGAIDSAPSRRDLGHFWENQGRQIARAKRCPSALQVHFQRALLLNAGGYTCFYCGRTAWGVYAEESGQTDPRTLRFEVDHHITRRRLSDPKQFDPENLVVACRSCNVVKAEMSEDVFRRELNSLATAVLRAAGDRTA
jgi:5-methylcytosine-specific restriction endonuclease McrA